MPGSINGIGTTYVGYRAPIQWREIRFLSVVSYRPDHDTIEWVQILLPIIPLKAVHTFAWEGNDHRTVPLRLTAGFVLRTYARIVLFLTFAAGLTVGAFTTLVAVLDPNVSSGLVWPAGGWIAFTTSILGLMTLRRSDRRNRDLRLVMGPHDLGSSDPALWAPQVLQTADFDADPVSAGEALSRGDFARAMLCARLCVARGIEDGERITDEILRDPRIVRALPALRKTPWNWGDILAGAAIEPMLPPAIG